MVESEGSSVQPRTDLALVLGGIAGRSVAFLCVGSEMHGDDAFGPAVAAALGSDFAAGVLDGGPAPENMLPAIARLEPEVVIVVDAVHFGAPPGTLAFLDPRRLTVGGFDTHSASLLPAVEFIEASCGAEVMLLACQPGGMELGSEMGEDVADAVTRAVQAIRDGVS